MGMGMGGFLGMGGSGLLNELLMQMDPPPTDQGWKTRMLRKLGLRMKKAASANTASAMLDSTTMRSSCAAARMSTH